MLNTLRISDIVLVEQAEIYFKTGFNVITGETGAGKSAILRALALVLGQRADAQSLRKGAEKGTVEASFDTGYPPALRSQLENSGIAYAEDEPLILRREITAAGKSRAFINNQLAQASLLRSVSIHLVEIVGQHSNLELRESDRQRALIDAYGNLESYITAFQTSWQEERRIRAELNHLVSTEAQRLRQLEEYQRQFTELEEAALQDGEEEELFAEYTKLINADELLVQVNGIYQLLCGEEGAVISSLSRQQSAFSKMASLDRELEEPFQLYKNALLELQEIAHTLGSYAGRIDSDPARADSINERLSLITKMKRKYGSTVAEVLAYQSKLQEELSTLNSADHRIEELRTSLQGAEVHTNQIAKKLSEERAKAASTLQQALTKQLRSLNMPKVDVRVDLMPTARHSYGDDHIEILFAPNVGEKLITIRECASGGELSRLVLALKALMADKEQKQTLVFDEVDANIGGETATVVGHKLADIGKQLQLVSITHFPQVARQAHHHIQIRKSEQDGRTRTHVQTLDGANRDEELLRMAGG